MCSYAVQLVHQEEELRREEEAYYQAVRAEAAARLGRVQRRKEKLQRLIAARNDPNKWLGENDSDWEMSVFHSVINFLIIYYLHLLYPCNCTVKMLAIPVSLPMMSGALNFFMFDLHVVLNLQKKIISPHYYLILFKAP